jgi:3-hydroxyisobutyrate dehydrogenase
MAKVAFLGLGVMGFPMAGHLKNKGGHEVTVYNRNAAKADKWVAQYGGKKAATPKEAASGQDFVMMCVGNDNDVREVALGGSGAFDGVKKGAVFVDHTTASAEVARQLHGEAKKRGFDFVDAPVSGGQAGAENGVLTVMCGGDDGPFGRAEPVIAPTRGCASCWGRRARASSPRWSTRFASRALFKASPKASTLRRRPVSTSRR